MKCCNHDCRQGRDCPYFKPVKAKNLIVVYLLLLVISLAVLV